jgi:hypothetical protein
MRRTRIKYYPGLERCEGRDLPSGLMVALASQTHVPRLSSALLAASVTAKGANGGIGSINTSGSSPLIGQGQPTKHELARDQFRAVFQGPVLVGPGRFTDQAKITYIRGTGSTSSFLHGDLNLGIVTPTDPNAPFSGVLVMSDKNNNSGGVLALDFTGARTAVDARGRPNHLTFNSDPNIYGGVFYVSSSTGTVDISYRSNGQAVVLIKGLVYTSGLTNPLKNAHALANGGFGK